MPLTKRQEITLYSVLHVPYGQKVFRLVDADNLFGFSVNVSPDHAAAVKIAERLIELESDLEALAELVVCLDSWYDLFGDSTQMDAGGVGSTTGVSFDLNEERKMIRERILAIIPFSREYMSGELARTQAGSLNIRVCR